MCSLNYVNRMFACSTPVYFGNPLSIIVKMPDCILRASSNSSQTIYVHFQTNALGKSINFLTPAMD